MADIEKLNIAKFGGGGQAWSDVHNLGPYCNGLLSRQYRQGWNL